MSGCDAREDPHPGCSASQRPLAAPSAGQGGWQSGYEHADQPRGARGPGTCPSTTADPTLLICKWTGFNEL